MASKINWEAVERGASRKHPDWYLVGHELPYTTAGALRRGKIAAMRGFAVSTRNTHHDKQGRRLCSIFVRKES